MKAILIGFLCIVLVTACDFTNPSDRDNSVINLEKSFQNISEIKISEVSNGISYVKLSTLDSVLIGKAPKICVTKKEILVSSNGQPLFSFDRSTGAFLNQIGHKGDDPEGYVDDGWGNTPFWVDQELEYVYLPKTMNSLLKYTSGGKLVKKIKLPDDQGIDLFNSNVYIWDDTIFLYNKYVCRVDIPKLLCCSSASGEVLWKVNSKEVLLPKYSEIEHDEFLFGNRVRYGGDMHKFYFDDNRSYIYTPEASSFWRKGNQLLFKENFVDTLFCIENNDLNHEMVMNLGKYAWQYNDRVLSEKSKNKLSVDYFYGNDDVLLVHTTKGLYENKDNRSYYLTAYWSDENIIKTSEGEFLVNDLDSLCPLAIWGVSTDKKFFSCLLPVDFLKWKSDYSIMDDRLPQELLFNPEDNPVIAIFE